MKVLQTERSDLIELKKGKRGEVAQYNSKMIGYGPATEKVLFVQYILLWC